MAERFTQSTFLIAAIVGASGASLPATAEEYSIISDTKDEVAYVFRGDIRVVSSDQRQFELFLIASPPKIINETPLTFGMATYVVNCAARTYKYFETSWLTENRVEPFMSMPVQNPPEVIAAPGSYVDKAINYVCTPDTATWEHSDDNAWDILRKKLASMKK